LSGTPAIVPAFLSAQSPSLKGKNWFYAIDRILMNHHAKNARNSIISPGILFVFVIIAAAIKSKQEPIMRCIVAVSTATAILCATLGFSRAAPAVPQLAYSPWKKVCGKGPDTNNKQVCVLTKDGRLENGMPAAIVQLFEPEGQSKVMRITVPLGMQLQHGTRVIIDQGQPVQEPYKICFPVGCMSDYPVTDDMIAKMKNGQTIIVQAINMKGTPISVPLPLDDFAKAYEGSTTRGKLEQSQASMACQMYPNLC
jgi:invasion protein IalB